MSKLNSITEFSLGTSIEILLTIFVIIFLFSINFLYADERKELIIEANIPVIQKLTVTETKSFPQISDDDFRKGYIELKDAATLMVSSNIPWKIIINSDQFNLYRSQEKFKSVENFQCRVGSAAYQSISNNELVIMEGEGGIIDYTIRLDYRMKVSWIDTPPGRWEFKPEFRIEPAEIRAGQYQKYSAGGMFSRSNCVNFPIITSEDLDRGYVDTKNSVRMSDIYSGRKSVKAGYITCESPYFSPYEARKPHRELLWKLSNESESRFRSIDFEMAEIYFARSFHDTGLDFRIMLDWSDLPGNYSMEGIVIIETEKIKHSSNKLETKKSTFE